MHFLCTCLASGSNNWALDRWSPGASLLQANGVTHCNGSHIKERQVGRKSEVPDFGVTEFELLV